MPEDSPSIRQPDYAAALAELEAEFGERLQRAQAVREQFGRDESFHPCMPPDAVIAPRDKAEVQSIVRLCARHRMPIIAHGAGTSLEGAVGAWRGGLCVDTAEMNKVLEISVEDAYAVVQPGVTRRQLNRELKGSGMFFPIDPGADATIGGMAATRASGTNAVRYGSMRENVINLEVVLADGSLIHTARRARKSSAGYDLTRLMVGSEGTLGWFTEVCVRLYPLPESIAAARCTFATVAEAVRSVTQIMQYGIPIARVELLDKMTMHAINKYSKTDYAEAPTLFLEFHGSAASVREQAEQTEQITADNGGNAFVWTDNPEERTKMWRARHDAGWATKQLHPKGQIWATDVCVPISRLAECIDATEQDIEQSDLLAPMVGHVGDGNFHLCILVDHDDPKQIARAEGLHDRMVHRALDLQGTCTGEHGIGYGKIPYMAKEHGEAVEPMRAIKRALDPHNLFNPGKLFAETGGVDAT